MKEKKQRGLLRYLDGFWRQSILAPLFKLLEALFDLLVPLVVAEIINVGINQGDTGVILRCCGLLVLLGVVGLACSITAQWFAAQAAIGYASLLLNLVRDRERQLAWSPVNKYIILYAGVYLAGTLFSVDLESSLQPGLLSVAFILFSIVLYNGVTNRNQLDTLVALMVLAGAIVSAYGILQYIFRWGYQSAAWVDSDMFSSIQFRVPSTLENPNMLGQYLILLIPLGGAKLLGAKDWLNRVFYLACCSVMCVCMILTFSRGA